MIRHAAIHRHLNLKFSSEVPKLINKCLVVQVIMKDDSPLITAIDDVVTSARIFDSEWASHKKSYGKKRKLQVKIAN